MTLLLIILVVLVLCGGGWGYRAGWYGPGFYNPIGLILVILVIVLLFGALGGPYLHWW